MPDAQETATSALPDDTPKTPENVEEGLQNSWGVISDALQTSVALIPGVILALIVLAVFVLVAYGLRHLISRTFLRKGRDDLGAILAGFAFWATTVFGILISLVVVLPSLKPGDLVSGLGIGSVAIGFAFKEILQNWLAGLLILLRQPFRRGDQIEFESATGVVQRITPRATLIRTFDNRQVVIPNAEIYTNRVTVNTAYARRRLSINVTIGYDYSIRSVTRIIIDAISDIETVLDNPPPQVLCWDLGATSLGLQVRWWIEPQQADAVVSRSHVVQAIKEAFQANDIDPTDPDLVYTLDQPPLQTAQTDAGGNTDRPRADRTASPAHQTAPWTGDTPDKGKAVTEASDGTVLGRPPADVAASREQEPAPEAIPVARDDPEAEIPRPDPGARLL